MRRTLVMALLVLADRSAGATSELDYVEHIFGITNVNAVGGHGRLTIGESADGDLTVLSWPSPGFDDQLAYFTSNDIDGRKLPHFGALDGMGSYLGLQIDTGTGPHITWLRDAATWTATQRYTQPDSVVPVTEFTSDALGLVVTVTDVVSPDVDVLTRHARVVRGAASPVLTANLVVYENLSPSVSRVEQIPIGDWALEAHNDFFAVWDEASHGILHVHPGDVEVFTTLIDLIGLTNDVSFGPVETLMKQAAPSQTAVDDFVATIDTSYSPGVAAIVTTEPQPASFQVGSDATPMCAFIDHLVDNVLALPTTFPTVNIPLSPDAATVLRCTDQLPRFATMHDWLWQPQDALADLADGALSSSPLAAAQTNGALITPLAFAGDTAEASMVVAFGATRGEAQIALANATAQPFAMRLASSEAASHGALASAPLPDLALGPRVVPVALRALANLYVARDRSTGAFLAAITRQPPYYLDWPRDGAFLSVAADLAGLTDWVTQRDEWYVSLIRKHSVLGNPLLQPNVTVDPTTGATEFPAGAWEMNYYVSGDAGGPIRFEIDNTALHVWSTAVHAAALSGADRSAFLDAVWPSDKAALDLLARWKERDTDLPAAANEDDNLALTSTLHGAVAVYAGLMAGARLGHAAGDDDAARGYLDRATKLRSAIDATYYDPETMLFRAARGLPGGPHDSIAGWDTGWLAWPARVLAPDDPRLELQLASDMAGILAILRGETLPGGTYTAKNVLAAALYGKPGGSRDSAETAVGLLSNIATPGTDSFGEVYMPEPGTPVAWSNRTATPHVWEGALFYLAAMALTDPKLFNREETELPLPSPGCGCGSSDPRGTIAPVLIVVLGLTAARRRTRRRARP